VDIASTLTDDWQFFDDPRTLTYEVKTANNPNTFSDAVSQENCIREAPTYTDRQLFANAETVFHLWLAKAGNIVPKNGDRITEADGTVWQVLHSERNDEGQRYRLTCQKVRGS